MNFSEDRWSEADDSPFWKKMLYWCASRAFSGWPMLTLIYGFVRIRQRSFANLRNQENRYFSIWPVHDYQNDWRYLLEGGWFFTSRSYFSPSCSRLLVWLLIAGSCGGIPQIPLYFAGQTYKILPKTLFNSYLELNSDTYVCPMVSVPVSAILSSPRS